MGLIAKILGSALLVGGVLIVALCLYVLKNYPTRISITGGEKPTFRLSGSGGIIGFVVIGPRQRTGNDYSSVTVWELIPNDQSSGERSVGGIGVIEYGSVPKGYKQRYPENDIPPPPIQPGESYLLQVYTDNAPWGQLAFELREGKAIERPIH